MKYILDAKEDPKLPKHLWFGKKYKTYPNSELDTSKWTKIVEETDVIERVNLKTISLFYLTQHSRISETKEVFQEECQKHHSLPENKQIYRGQNKGINFEEMQSSQQI